MVGGAMPLESCLMTILEVDHSSSAIDGEGARVPETGNARRFRSSTVTNVRYAEEHKSTPFSAVPQSVSPVGRRDAAALVSAVVERECTPAGARAFCLGLRKVTRPTAPARSL
jgi:hypothetical protein